MSWRRESFKKWTALLLVMTLCLSCVLTVASGAAAVSFKSHKNNATVSAATDLKITWNAVSGAASYKYTVADQSARSKELLSATGTTTSLTVAGKNLTPLHKLKVSVAAYSGKKATGKVLANGNLSLNLSGAKPNVITVNAKKITENSAQITVRLTKAGDANVTACGVLYGYSKAAVTTKAPIDIKGAASGDFIATITGLKDDTIVYYKAYATNKYGTDYGALKSFKTGDKDIPTVISLNPGEITTTSAKMGIQLKHTGESAVTECGIYWGYKENAVTQKLTFDLKSIKVGKYYETLKDLKSGSTVYYKAYAKNKAGVSYGSLEKFTTLKEAEVTHYRALLIGEYHFVGYNKEEGYHWENTQRNIQDVKRIHKLMDNTVVGPDGGKYAVTEGIDVPKAEILSLITKTFKDTTDNDVSFLFFATHGNSDGDGELMMPYLGKSVAGYLAFRKSPDCMLSFADLSRHIQKNVKGKVIIFLGSCGSGSSIYKSPYDAGNDGKLEGDTAAEFAETLEALEDEKNGNDDNELILNTPGETEKATDETVAEPQTEETPEMIVDFDPEAFNKKAIAAFAAVDEGIPSDPMEFDEKVDDNSTGDLRKSKYYVLTCAKHHQMSWGVEYGNEHSFNWFVEWLLEGIGSGKNSPADTDKNGMLTLNELYKYVKKYDSREFHIEGDKTIYHQNVQVYPSNSTYKVFKMR